MYFVKFECDFLVYCFFYYGLGIMLLELLGSEMFEFYFRLNEIRGRNGEFEFLKLS